MEKDNLHSTNACKWQIGARLNCSRVNNDCVSTLVPVLDSVAVELQCHESSSQDEIHPYQTCSHRQRHSVTSAPSVAVFRSRLTTHLFNISYRPPTVPAQWRLVALDTTIILAHLLTGAGTTDENRCIVTIAKWGGKCNCHRSQW